MSFVAADFAALATGTGGRTMTLRKSTRATYNAATDTFGTDSSADHSVTAVMMAPKAAWRAGQLVGTGDASAFLPASGIAAVPAKGDLLIDGATTWKVAAVREHKSGSTVIAYLLTLEA